MKVLVFGIGVIGAYLTHVLCEAGNEVTVLTREERVESLQKNGLVIKHHLQRKTTIDRVNAVSALGGESFDAVFVVMPYHKLRAAMPTICQFHTDLLILVGNDLTPAAFHAHIREHAAGIKEILFGFQVSAGKKKADRFVCERFGAGYMDIGLLHGPASGELKRQVEQMFSGTKYKLNWQNDMEAYLICHPAAILPIGYLSYICGGDLKNSTRAQRRMMFEASREAYDFLKASGVTIYPKGDDRFYGSGIRGKLMKFLYFVMSKTSIGDLVACEHCRNAVTEMEEIDLFYEKLMDGYPKEKLSVWNELRSKMPSWELLHRKYGN